MIEKPFRFPSRSSAPSARAWRRVFLFSALLGIFGLWSVHGQDVPLPEAPNIADPTTVFSHSHAGNLWLSGQINVINQGHGSFPAAYTGPNSLRPYAEDDTTTVLTLYTGYELNASTDVLMDVESASGNGISSAFGLAGFTDLDAVRNPQLSATPYLARLMVTKAFTLGGGSVENDRGPFSLATRLPSHRLVLRVGKFSLVDFFDFNEVGSDSHLQFMNWTIDNNGAYDYAANTRGYTWGAVMEYDAPVWALRFGEAMMPKVANGENLDADLFRAHSENVELELRPSVIPRRHSALRLLTYVNTADMGDYRQAINEYLAGLTPVPNITATRQQGRIKYGFGVNAEQDLTSLVRIFGRWGWNNGRTESFCYTEVDHTVDFGGDLRGIPWRPYDKVGAAYVVNGITGDHRRYLQLGGLGFLLGDGNLSYGQEQIFETYYTAHLWRGLFLSPDFQHIVNPAYNRVRGPVWVEAMRMHVDF
jgi:high affinity Mn2+ porin